MKAIFYAVVFSIPILVVSCIPSELKQEMEGTLKNTLIALNEQEFKKALGNIELHRLRTGEYPKTLHEIGYLGKMDSTMFKSVEYVKLDSGYVLNLKADGLGLNDGKPIEIEKRYSRAFWNGLGCKKSNMMEE